LFICYKTKVSFAFLALYIENQSAESDMRKDLDQKLHITRFICGLSEAKQKDDNGVVKVSSLNPVCIAHANEICDMYPFSSNEQKHFKSMIKLQVGMCDMSLLICYVANQKITGS